MSGNTNLWWAYDSENGSLQSLPAGPMLLPALGIIAFVAIAQAIKGKEISEEQFIGKNAVNSYEYKQDRARYYYLVDKRIKHGLGEGPELTVAEFNEKDKLSRKWIKSGRWTFS